MLNFKQNRQDASSNFMYKLKFDETPPSPENQQKNRRTWREHADMPQSSRGLGQIWGEKLIEN